MPKRPYLLLLLLILATGMLTACNSAARMPTARMSTATAAPPDPSPSPVPPTATPQGEAYDNPIYRPDFPDPFVLRAGDRYYAYSTNVGSVNVPMITSDDLVEWEFIGDALPALPDWAAIAASLTWAPGVLERDNGYVLYYTARYEAEGLQCISYAVSETPDGPFVDDSSEPFLCQLEMGGSIDPYPFVDSDGTPYLLWKNDGNCCGLPVKLWAQPLSEDGLSLEGSPAELIERDQAWERPLIENPAMWEHEGVYYLLYSGNWWESHEYAVGYAVCESVTGPCEKPQQEPILTFTPQVMGPGGEAFFTDVEGNLWLAYHAWTGPDVGYPGGARSLRIDPVTFEDGKPIIQGPTDEPQPLP
jgi:beta-xylosidase